MTQILVVDDSKFMRTVLGNALTDAGYDVETASDGQRAVESATETAFDVITMDVEMPEMGGIEAVKRIMAKNPTPIVMLSAYTERGADATLDALECGAVDFLHKPDGSDSRNIAHLVDSVVETIDELATADISSLALARASATTIDSTVDESDGRSATVSSPASPGSRSGHSSPSPGAGADSSTSNPGSTATLAGAASAVNTESSGGLSVDYESSTDSPTIIIGASTGGPKLIEDLLGQLPIGLDAKVLVVQHMPVDFTARFASRLDRCSSYHVREARDGDRITGGEVAVARGGAHLRVTNNVGGRLRVRFEDGKRIHGVRPAIDVTMESAAAVVTDPLVGVVLSGMGKDGAAGIEAIKHAGGLTIAQDESTSPIFGIPNAAIETGCVDAVTPACELVDRICEPFTTDTDGETNG